MFGAFELRAPQFLINRFGKGSQRRGLLGAYLSGVFAGIVASPCVGPVLVAILTYASTQQSGFFGFTLLFTYAIGLGLIFIVLGASTELLKKIPRSGPWLEGTKFILGSLMLAGFFNYFRFLVNEHIFRVFLGLVLVTLASIYGAFLTPTGSKPNLIRKGLMQAILILGFAFIVVGLMKTSLFGNDSGTFQEINFDKNKIWQKLTDEALEEARRNGKPVIIDFFADWCAACLELEEKVFSTPAFLERTKNMVLLKMDATKESAELDRLKKKYGIVGLPTILFIDSQGNWLKNKTLTEFENETSFLRRIENLK